MIRLDDETHQYWDGEQKVVGLSELLKYWGFIGNRYYTEDARIVGTAVHAGTEDYDRGGMSWQTLTDPAVTGRILAYQVFKQQMHFQPLHIEEIKAYPGNLYACRIDRIGTFRHSPELCLVELKCGVVERWHAYQTGGQQECWPGAQRRFALYLRPNGTFDLREHRGPEGRLVVGYASGYHYNQTHRIELGGERGKLNDGAGGASPAGNPADHRESRDDRGSDSERTGVRDSSDVPAAN